MSIVSIDFGDFAAADRLVVTTNTNRTLKTVTEGERIRAVLAVLHERTAGWTVPVDGVPVANLRLNFYQGERILGNVGLGRTFLAVHYRGNFWSQKSGTEVYDQVTSLLDLRIGAIKGTWSGGATNSGG
jgi:hypothetical protein